LTTTAVSPNNSPYNYIPNPHREEYVGKKLTEKMMPRLKASTVITHRKSPGSTAEEIGSNQ
jgi:hypothetical protein